MSSSLQHLNLIGRTIDIELQQGDDNANAYMFRGIIQNVAMEGQEGKHGYLILSGSSPTILMEKGKRYDVFTNLTLTQVFNQLIEDIISQKSNLPAVNAPTYTGQVEFLMQYNESDWEFLRRLSFIAKENMYWTGRDLVFGTHQDFPTMDVTYDREITGFEFGNRLLPNHFTRYQYLADKDDTLTQDAPSMIKGGNDYVNSAHEKAKVITEKRPARTPLDLSVSDTGSLNELVEHEKIGKASETIYIKGTAKTAHPRIGRLLRIKMPATMQGASDLGTYRITKVIHEFKLNDRYECQFEGIPADLKYYPLSDVAIPKADSIRGEVISNEDPQGIGRIRVDFPFASDRVSDAWLRVMTPSAGSSKVVEKNRGFVFIPEKGDQVMVGFEFGDPNRPYLMGSMFHGKNSEGGGSDNAIKSIITKSGIKVILNDDEGSAHIEVPCGSTFDMDGQKNISLYAPENINFKCKNMNIEVEETMTSNIGQDQITSIGNNKTEDIGETIETSANELKVSIDQNANIYEPV